jgi:hypothetical protein
MGSSMPSFHPSSTLSTKVLRHPSLPFASGLISSQAGRCIDLRTSLYRREALPLSRWLFQPRHLLSTPFRPHRRPLPSPSRANMDQPFYHRVLATKVSSPTGKDPSVHDDERVRRFLVDRDESVRRLRSCAQTLPSLSSTKAESRICRYSLSSSFSPPSPNSSSPSTVPPLSIATSSTTPSPSSPSAPANAQRLPLVNGRSSKRTPPLLPRQHLLLPRGDPLLRRS